MFEASINSPIISLLLLDIKLRKLKSYLRWMRHVVRAPIQNINRVLKWNKLLIMKIRGKRIEDTWCEFEEERL